MLPGSYALSPGLFWARTGECFCSTLALAAAPLCSSLEEPPITAASLCPDTDQPQPSWVLLGLCAHEVHGGADSGRHRPPVLRGMRPPLQVLTWVGLRQVLTEVSASLTWPIGLPGHVWNPMARLNFLLQWA